MAQEIKKDMILHRIAVTQGDCPSVRVADFILQSLDTVITPVSMEGVYIANKRKLLVK